MAGVLGEEEMYMRALLVPKLALGALALSAIFGAPSTGVLAQGALPLKLTAFAINMNSGPKTATVDIVINNWSTEAQRDQLLAILQEQKDVYKANQALLKALQKMPKLGYIRTPERLAWDLRYARENKGEDGGRQKPETQPWHTRRMGDDASQQDLSFGDVSQPTRTLVTRSTWGKATTASRPLR